MFQRRHVRFRKRTRVTSGAGSESRKRSALSFRRDDRMSPNMLPLKRILFAWGALAAVLSAQAQSSALINGRVVNAVDGSPIENASAKLDLNPADGMPEKQAQTDPFGFF